MKNKINQNKLYRALCLSAACVFTTPMVYAQDDSVEELGKVQVTGSRIRQSQIEGIEPTQTLTREDIDRSGLTSVGDILQQLTQSGSALNTRFNSSGNFGFPANGGGIGAGSTQIDMRHLDPGRVLVLVDGLRWVAGSSGSGVSNAVDLNTIPVGIIERIDILKDGASSIYGADAIAGVVNIITKKSMQGVEARVYLGAFDEGDGETGSIDLTFGNQTDKMNMLFNVGYTDQQEVSAADRFLSQFPVPFTGVTRGSSGTPQGRFLLNDINGTEIDCTLNAGVIGPINYDPTSPCNGDDYNTWDNGDRFNFAPYNYYVTPSERSNIFGQVTVELTDNITWFVKGVYNNRKSTNQAAPEPIFIGPFAEAGAIADNIVIDASNPYNPFGVNVFEDGFGFIGRRPLEAGPRVFNQNVDTTYFSTGLEGSFNAADRSWFWDVSGVYGKNQASQRKTGALNIARIATALGPVDVCNNTPGCVPLNIFGGQGDGSGTITPEMLNYISFVQSDNSEQELTDFSANISGDLFELPAGPLSVAVGYEYRRKSGFFQPDAIVVAGESNGVPASPTSGEFSVDEFYAEFLIPVLADQPFAELLDFSLAFRSSDYSTSGSDTTGKFGFKYMPNSNLMFRGSFAEGLRAPSIGELFGTQARFDAQLNDPCNFGGPGLPGCAGVPSDYEQLNPQISTLTGGNPNLSPEEAETLTLGFVYSPSWADDRSWSSSLDFEVTYYDIEIDGAIQAVDAQFILDSCAANAASPLCSNFSRDSFGNIENFSNQLTNIGSIETSGVDFNVNWTSPQFDWGYLQASWNNSFVNEFTEDGRDLDGIEASDSGIPDWNSNLYTTVNYRDWKVTWGTRHINGLTETCAGFLIGQGLCSDEAAGTNNLGGTTYHDLQVIFPEWNSIQFEAGVNNITDKRPPTCFSCSLNGYDPSNYDGEGQFGYVRATIKF
ncbi:TonB-dependent receptor domain-containing protein [Marinicella litoralis]|uniref:Iron complex outermembrane receptor protein n=1 Tax=Marinicella litoralis TaxID=644220 RepID=A0A4R6XWF2_9GAMM|nr:TonB-dependent receptor [Marinicella litoralis]TDR22770.1 iron complex outermembrane receptor protein [Marinicella litoralis]